VKSCITSEPVPKNLNLKRVVAGLKMAHLPKITSSLEFWSARPDGARV
jgi:hypothetical protein